MAERTSVRMFIDRAAGTWLDSDPVESKFEDPEPTRIDLLILKLSGVVELSWAQAGFAGARADDVDPADHPGMVGRKRRGFNLSYDECIADITADIPDNSLAFTNFRHRTVGGPVFAGFNGGAITRVDIYEIQQVRGGVIRAWSISDLSVDSYDDFNRDRSPNAAFVQELLVYTFDPADVSQITDMALQRLGKRPVDPAGP